MAININHDTNDISTHSGGAPTIGGVTIGSGVTNLGITNGTTAGPIITSSTGTNATFPTASATISGAVTTGNQTWAGIKTFNSRIIVTNTFDINGSGAGAQQNGLYVADLGTTQGTTLNPAYTAAICGQISTARSIALSVDDNGYLWGYRGHSNAGTYTFQSKAKFADEVNNGVYTIGDQAISGIKTFSSNIITPNIVLHGINQIRIKTSSGSNGYGLIHRQDSANYHLLLTNNDDANGTWNDFRPLVINLATGNIILGANAGGLLSTTTIGGTLQLASGTTTRVPLNIPHGSAPTSPVNGDIWTTTSSVVARINGTTRDLFHLGNLADVSQAEAEAGTATTRRTWTAQRVAQAITALARKINVADTRNDITTPETESRGVYFDFKTNASAELTDGGSFTGLMTFRKWGTNLSDWSGGKSAQLAFTDNGNIWQRSGTGTSWDGWKMLLDTNNMNHRRYSMTGTGFDYNNAALEIREVNHVEATQSSYVFAPNIGFHWGNRTAATLALHSDGHFHFRGQGFSGTQYRNISASGFNVISKREAKENIEAFNVSALDLLNSVDIVRYNYISDEEKALRIGFIADNTDPILSGSNKDKFDTTNVVAVSVKAIQELTQENIELKTKVNQLENEITYIKEIMKGLIK